MTKFFSTTWMVRLLLVYLLVTGTIILTVDILNLFGSQAIMKSIEGMFDIKRFEVPLFWYFISTQGSFTENVQWLYLFFVVATLFTITKSLKASGEIHLFRAFRLWTIAAFLLFLEDTLNTRHWLRRFFALVLDFNDPLESPAAIAVEVSTYAIMATLMVISFVRLLPLFFRCKKALLLLVAGYGFYGVAAFFSATRHLNNWYMRFGDALIGRLGFDTIETWRIANETIEARGKNLGYYFMDYLVEETLELLGAACLAIGAVLLYQLLKTHAFKNPLPNHEQS